MPSKEELNLKLAKWAGFKTEPWWEYPTGEQIRTEEMPTFHKSLDACFKWLIPKLSGEYWITLEKHFQKPSVWIATIGFVGAKDMTAEAETPALALFWVLVWLSGS